MWSGQVKCPRPAGDWKVTGLDIVLEKEGPGFSFSMLVRREVRDTDKAVSIKRE